MTEASRHDPDAGPVETEGQEAYPTYHDRPDSVGTPVGTRPTDANLPQSRRTVGSPMLLGILAFAAALIVIIAIATINLVKMPADSAAPTETSIGAPMTSIDGATGSFDSDTGSTASPPAGSPPPTPSAVDVPGGQ